MWVSNSYSIIITKGHTMTGEVEEDGHLLDRAVGVARVWETRARVAQLVEEWVHHGVDRRQTLGRCVLEQAGDEVDGVGVSLAEDLVEWVRLDLRELVLHVVRVHGADLVAGRRAEHLDDLNELVDTRLAREQGLAQHELGHHAASRPHIYI